jgi:hypothetical protein
MMKFNVPTVLATVLAIVAGLAQYFNQATFGLSPAWHSALTYGILLISLLGISPLVGAEIGAAIRNLLHISATLTTVIGLVIFAASAAVTTFSLSMDVKGLILGILAFLAAIGFGPVAPGTPVPAPPAPTAAPAA